MSNVVLFPLSPSSDGGPPKARFDLTSMTLSQLENLRDALATVDDALQMVNALALAASCLILRDERV